MRYGYRPRGRVFDVMLMKYLLDEERPHDLKSLVGNLLPEFDGYDLQPKPGKKSKPTIMREFWENVELNELSKYCAGDAEFTLRIGIYLEHRLIVKGLYKAFRNMYMPLVRLLSVTILEGVMVDRAYLTQQKIEYKKFIDDNFRVLMDTPLITSYNEEFIESKKDNFIYDLEDEIDRGDLSDRQISAREEKISRIEAGDPKTKKELELFEDINFGSPKQLIGLLFENEDHQYPPLV